jgi:ankyrin repeat protein
LPHQKDALQRTDSGSSSHIWVNSDFDHTVADLVNKNLIERRNTPAENDTGKLDPKLSSFLVKPSIKNAHLVSKTKKPKSNSPQKRVKIGRKITLFSKIKKNLRPKSHKKKTLHNAKSNLSLDISANKLISKLITSGDCEKLSDFLSKINVGLEFKDLVGNTPFNIAAQNGYVNILEVLLKNGAYWDTQNNEGNTPMHYACTYNFPLVLDLLINNGADQTILNKKGKTPWEGI